MRAVRELWRFLLTAIAVAFAIPIIFTLYSVIDGMGPESMESYAGVGALSFILALVGGSVVGLPALWIARLGGWNRSLPKMMVWGFAMGALSGALLAPLFFADDRTLALIVLPAWSIFGAIAGLVAAAVWVLLHRSDADPEPV